MQMAPLLANLLSNLELPDWLTVTSLPRELGSSGLFCPTADFLMNEHATSLRLNYYIRGVMRC